MFTVRASGEVLTGLDLEEAAYVACTVSGHACGIDQSRVMLDMTRLPAGETRKLRARGGRDDAYVTRTERP